jgi:hypothetical protein
MIKKGFIVATALVLGLLALFPGLSAAQNGLEVRASSVEVDFPARITFDITATSDAEITDIRLCYQVDRLHFADVVSEVKIDFAPALDVTTFWTLEMVRIGGLPPGSSLDYWWRVTDAVGREVETEPERVIFEDNRFDWQTLTEGMVTLYWYQGDSDFAAELMATAQTALDHLYDFTGVELDSPVKLYIYATSAELQGSMIYPQEWTGGVAFTRYGIMAIGVSQSNLDWGKDAVAHELTHLVIEQVILNPYGGIPVWLNEGLAMSSERDLDDSLANYLNGAIASRDFISVKSLASPFSAYSGEAALSYAQSYSIVQYLVSTYGQEKMFELLTTFSEGATYDGALEEVYGFDTAGLDALWQEWVVQPENAVSLVEPDSSALAGVS